MTMCKQNFAYQGFIPSHVHIHGYFRTFLNAEISLDQLPLAKVSSESYTDKELYCVTCDASSERRTAERHCKKCDAAFCKEHIKVFFLPDFRELFKT